MTHRTEAEWNALRDQRDDNDLDAPLAAELAAHDAGSDYTIVARCGEYAEHGAHMYRNESGFYRPCGGNVGGAIIEHGIARRGHCQECDDFLDGCTR